MSAAPKGINGTAVTRWAASHVETIKPPLTFELIAGGRSNLTFLVTDSAGTRVVLRRPPLGRVRASAHDVAREYRLLTALRETAVPVPEPLACCEDTDVTGAPFYVMSFVDGVIARSRRVTSELLTPVAREAASRSVVDVLADLHAVDPLAIGLPDPSRQPGGETYVHRQLRRFGSQLAEQETPRTAALARLLAWLREQAPADSVVGIVHGDYRLDNCVCAPDGRVVAVLDWELCTVGDVLADVAFLLTTWTRPGDAAPAWPASATTLDGFLERDDLVARYAERSGRPVGELAYYAVFALWRLACISEGVYARYQAGAMGAVDEDELAAMAARVASFTEAAEAATALADC